MNQLFKVRAIKHMHLAATFGISQSALVQFVRDNLYRYGVTRAGLREDAVFTLEEALCICIHFGASAQQVSDILRTFPDALQSPPQSSSGSTTSQPAASQDATLAAEILRALFSNSEFSAALQQRKHTAAMLAFGLRIEGEELWIGTSVQGFAQWLRSAWARSGSAKDQLMRIPGAKVIGPKKYRNATSRGIALPIDAVLIMLDETVWPSSYSS